MSETIFAQWVIDKSQYRFWIFLVTFFVVSLFFLSFYFLYVITKTDNILFASLPIVSLLVMLGVLPESIKAWDCLSEEGQVYVTEKGIYLKDLSDPNKYKFVSWENIASYDLKYFSSMTPIGIFFPKPTQFYLKGKYEEDSFSFAAFGENIDVTRAYLKEKNVSFGFIKS